MNSIPIISSHECGFRNSFTARNSSCGKVMFSQVCVIPSVRGEGVCIQWGLPGGSACGVCLGGSASRGSAYIKGGLHPTGVCLKGLHPGGWADPPVLDTTGYSQRVGGTHPTGMHSCKRNKLKINLLDINCLYTGMIER